MRRVHLFKPYICAALLRAYGYDALNMSKFGSPLSAMPSRRPRPRVINAKKGETLNGYRKKTSFNSFEIVINFRFLACRLEPGSNK